MEDLHTDIAAYLRTQRELVARRQAPGALSPLAKALRHPDTYAVKDQSCPACGKAGLWRHFLYGQPGIVLCARCG